MIQRTLSNQALVLLLLAAIAVAFVSIRSVEKSPAEFHERNDFAHYAISSLRLLRGENPYREPISAEYAERGFVNRPIIDRATNPPALLVLVLPFALLPPLVGFWCWTGCQLSALVAGVRGLVSLLGVRLQRREWGALFCAIGVMYPVVAHIEYAQTQLLMLGLVVWGCVEWKRRGDRSLGWPFLWGIATSLKLFTWPLCFLVLARGGARAGGMFALGCVAFSLPVLLAGGPGVITDYVQYAIPYIQATVLAFNGSNSLTGAIRYSIEAVSGVQLTLSSLNTLNQLSSGLLGVWVAACSWCWSRCSTNSTYEFLRQVAVVLLMSCALSPTSWNHYLVLAIFPLLVLLQRVCTPRGEAELKRRELNLLSALIAYLLIALSQGRVSTVGVEWTFITSWWGLGACGYLGWLLRR